MSVAYIGLKSRIERPRKTKIGTEVAHVTLTQKPLSRSKRRRSTCRGRGILWRPPAQLVKLKIKLASPYTYKGQKRDKRDILNIDNAGFGLILTTSLTAIRP